MYGLMIRHFAELSAVAARLKVLRFSSGKITDFLDQERRSVDSNMIVHRKTVSHFRNLWMRTIA